MHCSPGNNHSDQACVVCVHDFGGTDRLKVETRVLLPPGPQEIRVRNRAIGVNFVDVYHRTGAYRLPSLPAVLGVEGTGVIEAVGQDVLHLRVGQRVAYAGQSVGSYASARNLPADKAVPLPDDVAEDAIAASLLRGITAHMLFAYVWRLQPGDRVLVHAAAGGLGLVLVQWAKALGAEVYGTVSTPAKAERARKLGLDHAILYREQDFPTAIQDLTAGRGVDYAIDGIGGETLLATLGVVRPFGMVASVGQVSGDSHPLDPSLLGPARSIALARPGVIRFMSDPERYREGASATLERLQAGLLATVAEVLPLDQAAEAHRQLESGRHAGAILLRP